MTRTAVPQALVALSLLAGATGCGDQDEPAKPAAANTGLAAYCYATATLDNSGLFNAREAEEVEHEVAEARVALTAMRDHAPASVASAVSTVAEPFNQLLDTFEKHRFKPGSADPSAMGAPEVQKASEALKADTPKTCGVTLP